MNCNNDTTAKTKTRYSLLDHCWFSVIFQCKNTRKPQFLPVFFLVWRLDVVLSEFRHLNWNAIGAEIPQLSIIMVVVLVIVIIAAFVLFFLFCRKPLHYYFLWCEFFWPMTSSHWSMQCQKGIFSMIYATLNVKYLAIV